MIYPIYEFELSATLNGKTTHRQVKPIYSDELSIDVSKETNEEFFRKSLSGKLTFVREDFDFINSQDFESEFELRILISRNLGESFAQYWTGKFWKTDCEFNLDDKIVSVKPEVSDEYSAVLAGMDKEYDLINLAPEMQPITVTKRPMIQVYVPGQSVIACFLSGMYWETDCAEVDNASDLVNKYHFAKVATGLVAETSGNVTPQLPDAFIGGVESDMAGSFKAFSIAKDNYIYAYSYKTVGEDDPTTGESEFVTYTYWKILSGGVEMWSKTDRHIGNIPVSALLDVTLNAVSGSGASGDVTIKSSATDVYSRFVTDRENVANVNTYALGADDMVGNNRNYHRAVGYDFKDTIYFTGNLSTQPTKWGIYQPNKYYQEPYALGVPAFYPVSKSAWGRMSVWFAFSAIDEVVENSGRKEYELRNAYPLSSAISVLLKTIAPEITHEPTAEYSQFLYSARNPIDNTAYKLFITPKSNILAGEYDQPAQKAPITLRYITDMLRDCFRCYWYVEDGKFKIEHIQFFRNGGKYLGKPKIGIKLTELKLPRNGKPWAFGTSTYTYDKSDMPERYQFGWMDDVTSPFEGEPIEIESKYVEKGNIEEITVANFTSDIDYMLLNPSACSSDGFALLGAVKNGNGYKLPILKIELNQVEYYLQNLYLAFCYLQNYYLYDMPARYVKFNGNIIAAQGIKKQKTQDVQFPMLLDANLIELVKTELGNGEIAKISLNLSSRGAKVTLKYDTE